MVLSQIIEHKRKEVEERKNLVPVKLLENSTYFESQTVSLKESLLSPNKFGIIAEIKRRSPSKGVINQDLSIERTSIGYVQAGASAISVLTDKKFFGGSNEDLTTVRRFNSCPILRKDFIIDEYQIIEAKSIGADAILLIAAVLTPFMIRTLTALAHSLRLEVLLEVHDQNEINLNVQSFADVIGVNNRNLKTMIVDSNTSKELVHHILREAVKISESGISSPDKIIELRNYGYQGFLIGEAFMQRSSPEKACKEFMDELLIHSA